VNEMLSGFGKCCITTYTTPTSCNVNLVRSYRLCCTLPGLLFQLYYLVLFFICLQDVHLSRCCSDYSESSHRRVLSGESLEKIQGATVSPYWCAYYDISQSLCPLNLTTRAVLGTLVTCGALIMATVKMRRGDSQSLNNWLRVRVISQGATIAAVCAGTYALGSTAGEETKQTRQLDEIQAHREARAGRDRKEFEDRLKDAERQWKETEGALSGRQSNSNVAKGDSTSKALPSVEGQVPRSTSSQSSASWWWFKWPWGGSSAS